MSNATVDKTTVEKPKDAPKAPVFEDDDLVAIVHRNWHAFDLRTHAPLIPDDRETYLDSYTFVGGIGRNIPYAHAKKWVKLGIITPLHIFSNNAQTEEFARVLGRDAMAPQTLAGAVAALSPEKAASLLGEDAAEQFAKSLLRLISSRKQAQEA